MNKLEVPNMSPKLSAYYRICRTGVPVHNAEFPVNKSVDLLAVFIPCRCDTVHKFFSLFYSLQLSLSEELLMDSDDGCLWCLLLVVFYVLVFAVYLSQDTLAQFLCNNFRNVHRN